MGALQGSSLTAPMSGSARHRARPGLPTTRNKVARRAPRGRRGIAPRSGRRSSSTLELVLALIRRNLW